MATPEPPRYGTASLAEVLPSVLAGMGVPGASGPLHLPVSRRVVLLLVDGLGWRQLRDHRHLAPFLAGAGGRAIDTVFPSTTVTAITSLATGLAPAVHGLVGYSIAAPGDGEVLNLLEWELGVPGRTVSALGEFPPEALQAAPTLFEEARRQGVAVTVVGQSRYAGSGLTRAALRGARYVGALDVGDALEAAVAAVTASPGPSLAYAHHAGIDAAGHRHGPGSPAWARALTAVDAALERAVESLPEGVSLVVTADHGMVPEADDCFVELSQEPALAQGVRVLAGEARTRQLWVEPGAAEDVAAAYRERLGRGFAVRTRRQALEAGWFGPPGTTDRDGRIGQVVVASLGRGALVHRDLDRDGGRLAGMHGSLTREEMEVPLLVLP